MFKEGTSHRIVRGDDDLWHCIHCTFSSDHYQRVVGHLGWHATRSQPVGRPRKVSDPFDMTFTQLADALDKLRQENVKLTTLLNKERARNAKIRTVLADFMRNGQEATDA